MSSSPRHRTTKVLWAAYPVLVFWVVVVTANHFWIDGAAGLLVAVLAAFAARYPGPRPSCRLVLPPRDHLTARVALRRYGEPGLVAAALGVAYLIVQPDSADHAAQVFRSGLFDSQGFAAWDNFWFGGHHLPGYGLLLPALGALIGPRLVGVLSAVIASLLFSAIAYRRFGERARLGVIWFATATSISLFTGRLTFALGVAVALAAVFAMQSGYRLLAIFFAALTPLASPVAALFLACGVVAYAIAERSRRGLELAADHGRDGGADVLRVPGGRHRAVRLLQLRAGNPRDDRRLRRPAYGGAPAPLQRRRLRGGAHCRPS